MSSSFFLKKPTKLNNKRKINRISGAKKGKSKKLSTLESLPKQRLQRNDEEIASDDDDYRSGNDEIESANNLVFSSDEGEEETPQDKRLRLAKQYLKEIEKQEAERREETEVHYNITQRLQTEYLDSVGRLRKNIASSIEDYDKENIATLKHKRQSLSLCCLALTSDEKFLFSGAKSQFVLKWNLETLKVEGIFNVSLHTEEIKKDIKRRSHVIAMCLSSDMRYLAIAEGGINIQIWCPKELKHIKTFKGHRDVVTSLVFRKDSHDLYSGSRDRSVKIWSLTEMAYVESLFGHQAAITDVDALSRERAITSGGSDCTLRIWKITEESQLIYNGHYGNIELVKFLNDEHFVSASSQGSLCLWSALKKKPLYSITYAHGKQNNGEANWITSIACVVNTDLIASGSSDGFIRLWQSSDNYKKLTQILNIPLIGFINSLMFNSDGTKLIVAAGQEHRLGRWWRVTESKNYIVLVDLITNPIKSKH